MADSCILSEAWETSQERTQYKYPNKAYDSSMLKVIHYHKEIIKGQISDVTLQKKSLAFLRKYVYIKKELNVCEIFK